MTEKYTTVNKSMTVNKSCSWLLNIIFEDGTEAFLQFARVKGNV